MSQCRLNAGPLSMMLGQCRRRCANIKSTLIQGLVIAGITSRCDCVRRQEWHIFLRFEIAHLFVFTAIDFCLVTQITLETDSMWYDLVVRHYIWGFSAN